MSEIELRGLMGIEPNVADNYLTVRFRDQSNDVLTLKIGSGYLGGFIVGLISQASHLRDAGVNQPMTLTSIRPLTIGDGRRGIMMVLDDAARLPVLFPPAAIQALRTVLDTLEGLSTSGPTEPQRH